MHVLFLPKWYPGHNDPQLGDFLRKQALATGAYVRLSVLQVEAITQAGELPSDVLTTTDGAWELCLRYRASMATFTPMRKAVNFVRYWRTMQRGWVRIVNERGKPDLLHAYILVRPVLFAWWKAQVHRLPFLISEQSSEYLDGTYAGKGPFFKAMNHFLFRRAAAVTVVSAWLGDALVKHGLCTRYDVVPNVVPGLDRPLPPAGAPGHFLMVADLVDRTKNVSGALRALAIALRTNADLRLTIIGDGPDRKMLEDLTDELGLRKSVQFLGRVPNTVVLDRMATIFAVIINSNVETFSVVTGEALAQGKPVIATRCGGPVAFITEVNGILIEPKDDAALAMAMLQLTAHATEYEPTRIRASVSDRTTPAAVGAAFHQVYQRILPNAR
ncbi:MAG: glycosyltransferase [Flavobacteriales bacterium]|nr:glycosyltransferase [Flavobacteriales bacterium]